MSLYKHSQAQVASSRSSKILQTLHGAAAHLQEKQTLYFHDLSFPHFPAILVRNNRRLQ